MAERTLQIFDQDFQIGAVERDAAGEGFADQLERHRHVGDHGFGAVWILQALTDSQRLAHRHELRIALDIGDEIEHLRRAVLDPALAGELRHREISASSRESRACGL